MKKIITLLCSMFNRFNEDNVTVYSAYASFYMVISFVPFLILTLMIIGKVTTVTSADFVEFAGNNMPKSVINFIVYMIDEYLKADVGIISIPVITLLWTSSRSVVAVTRGLDTIYKSPKPKGIIGINIYGLFYTTLFLLVIMLSLIVLVFGNVIANFVGSLFPFMINILNTILSIRPLVTIVVLTMFFTCIYTLIPSRKLKIFEQLPGALFASSGWMIFSFLFSVYFDNFSDKSYIYGSLTALILLMLWIYFCMLILFIGGEINCYLLNKRKDANNE